MRFWYGSGSSDPYLCLTDPDAHPAPDPALFASDLQDATKNNFLLSLCLSFLEVIFTSFFKDKKSERSHKREEIEIVPYFFAG